DEEHGFAGQAVVGAVQGDGGGGAGDRVGDLLAGGKRALDSADGRIRHGSTPGVVRGSIKAPGWCSTTTGGRLARCHKPIFMWRLSQHAPWNPAAWPTMCGHSRCGIMPPMTDRLEVTAQAHREAVAEEAAALAALKEAQAHRKAAGTKVAQTRAPLAEAIVEAARTGMRQVDIVRISGYNREHVRRICRAAGVEPVE